jgi:hypothetical protein
MGFGIPISRKIAWQVAKKNTLLVELIRSEFLYVKFNEELIFGILIKLSDLGFALYT